MAGSRLEKFGTVFTRVRDLMRAGVMKEKDKPIWYDVYAAFPPKREPLYVKPQTRVYRERTDTVPDIFYKEDAVRAKFYQVYGNGPKAFELGKASFVSTCERFVEKYQDLEAKGELEGEALFEGAGRALLAEGVILRKRGGAKVVPESREAVLDMKLKDMLEEQLSGQHSDSLTEQIQMQSEQLSDSLTEQIQTQSEQLSDSLTEQIQMQSEQLSDSLTEQIQTQSEQLSDSLTEQIQMQSEQLSDSLTEQMQTQSEQLSDSLTEQIQTQSEQLSDSLTEQIHPQSEQLSNSLTEQIQMQSEQLSNSLTKPIPPQSEQLSDSQTEQIQLQSEQPSVTQEQVQAEAQTELPSTSQAVGEQKGSLSSLKSS
ncbi:hypothetical protein GJAV_G00060270 [Gymnothorax javanicus]|nr:hypothetical protein GJAV_G00060270 [Gymnothorax javanicus]